MGLPQVGGPQWDCSWGTQLNRPANDLLLPMMMLLSSRTVFIGLSKSLAGLLSWVPQLTWAK